MGIEIRAEAEAARSVVMRRHFKKYKESVKQVPEHCTLEEAFRS
jgi:hypothetical protein